MLVSAGSQRVGGGEARGAGCRVATGDRATEPVPTIPPTVASNSDSVRNWPAMCRRRAPLLCRTGTRTARAPGRSPHAAHRAGPLGTDEGGHSYFIASFTHRTTERLRTSRSIAARRLPPQPQQSGPLALRHATVGRNPPLDVLVHPVRQGALVDPDYLKPPARSASSPARCVPLRPGTPGRTTALFHP
jgi:hypothetical protein